MNHVLPRRAFLVLLGCGLLSCNSRSSAPHQSRRVNLGSVDNFKTGRTPLPLLRLVVVKDERGFGVISLACTHQKCLLNPPAADGVFLCPCHGATFSAQGEVLSGPATEPLPWFELSLDADRTLSADLSRPVAPGWRLAI